MNVISSEFILNIMQAFKLSLVLTLLVYSVFTARAQQSPVNKYGLSTLNTREAYEKAVLADSNKRMVPLKSMVPALVYELRYATTDNFMQRRMYPSNTNITFLRLPAARALARVQQQLLAHGYGLKVWDAYRPYAVTEKFWEMVKDERYVAYPGKGSGHNRGLAIDVTLIELSSGRELDMGTSFDNFSDTAHHVFTNLPPAVLQKRKLLKETMEAHGFAAFESEWWHYSFPNTRQYEVLDLPFRLLRRLSAVKQ
jgi:zinc D-Ala-D-Ala dipeptidase